MQIIFKLISLSIILGLIAGAILGGWYLLRDHLPEEIRNNSAATLLDKGLGESIKLTKQLTEEVKIDVFPITANQVKKLLDMSASRRASSGTLMYIYSTDCIDCASNLDEVNELAATLKERLNILAIGIAPEQEVIAKLLAKQAPLNFRPLYMANGQDMMLRQVVSAYGLTYKNPPFLAFMDASGAMRTIPSGLGRGDDIIRKITELCE